MTLHAEHCTGYKASPELRRCCWYLLLAACVVPVLLLYIHLVVLQRPWLGCAIAAVFIGGICFLPALFGLTWRVELREHSLARRLLFWWDEWCWDDFANGRVEKSIGYRLVHRDRPWWRRRMRLEFLGPVNVRPVFDAINRHFALPQAEPVAAELTLLLRPTGELTLRPEGLELRKRKQTTTYSWNQVQYLCLRREDPKRRDFNTLHVGLADQEVTLRRFVHNGVVHTIWKGATVEQVSDWISEYAPNHLVHDSSDELMPPEFLERRLTEARRKYAGVWWLFAVTTAVLGTLLLVGFHNFLPGLAAMACMLVVNPGSLFIFLLYDWRRSVRELEQQWFDSVADRNTVESALPASAKRDFEPANQVSCVQKATPHHASRSSRARFVSGTPTW